MLEKSTKIRIYLCFRFVSQNCFQLSITLLILEMQQRTEAEERHFHLMMNRLLEEMFDKLDQHCTHLTVLPFFFNCHRPYKC